MENRKIEAPDDVPPHHDHRPQPIRHTEDNEHDVFDVAKHLGQFEMGPQDHLANKLRDDSAHFTSNPNFAREGQQDDPSKPKHFIQSAIKHPGRVTEAAKRQGVSVHQEAEKMSHSSDASEGGAGNLALRFQKGGDLHQGKK